MNDERETLADWLARLCTENPTQRGWRCVVTHLRGHQSTPVGHLYMTPGEDVISVAARLEGAIDNERGVFPGRQVYEVSFAFHDAARPIARFLVRCGDEHAPGSMLLEGGGGPALGGAGEGFALAQSLGNSQRHVENLHRANLELTKLVISQAAAQSRVDSERLKRAEEREDKVSELYFKLMRGDREFEYTATKDQAELRFKQEAAGRLFQLAPLLLGSKVEIGDHPIMLALSEFASSLSEEEIAAMVGPLPPHKQVAILEVIVRLKKAREAKPESESRH